MHLRWSRIQRAALYVAIIWLVVDFLSLPRSAGVKRMFATAWSWISQRARPLGGPWTEEATIHRDPRGLWLDFELQHYEEPTVIGVGWLYPSRRLLGWWAPTSEAYRPELYLFPEAAPFTENDMQEIRDLFAKRMEQLEMYDFAEWVRLGQVRVERPLPLGYVRNTLAVICAGFVVFATVGSLRRKILAMQRRRRLVHGRCPSCGYDLQGTLGESCPECGLKHKLNC